MRATTSRSTLRCVILVTLCALVGACDRRSSAAKDSATTPPIAAPSVKEEGNANDALERRAEAGDAKAQIALAEELQKTNSPKKLIAACKWFEKAATGGSSVDGMVGAARCYAGDHGIPMDFDRANEWWRKAAEKGNAEAEYQYGSAHVWVQKSGTLIFSNGEPKKVLEDFVVWETRASEHGYAQATNALGMTYLLGAKWAKGDERLSEPDIDEGVKLLKRAADAGYWYSQWALAVLYEVGFRTVAVDKALSDHYWDLLSAQSSVEAQRGIAFLYQETNAKTYQDGRNKFRGRPLTYAETNYVARDWFEKAALQDDPDSLAQLGFMYRDGMGITADPQKGASYFKRSADLGNFQSMGALAFAYGQGVGVVRDYDAAFKWLLAAANENETIDWSRVHGLRNSVGEFYENGWGTSKDMVLAYAWYNVAAAGGNADAKKNVARLEPQLSAEKLKEAQSMSSSWVPGNEMRSVVRVASTSEEAHGAEGRESTTGSLERRSVGSGFYISPDGIILTNNHVIAECTEIRVPSEGKAARLVVTDPQNDLAVVAVAVTGKQALTFPEADDIHQGETLYVFGFPLEGYLPSAGNFTPGMVAALAGPENNASLIQITAPVQPGNSGGPVLDSKGRVIGVVVGKLDALKIAKATGDIPQNANFAIAPQTVQAFLTGNHLSVHKAPKFLSFDKSAVDIAGLASGATVKVECWR